MTRLCVTEYAGFIVRFPLDDPQMIPKKLNLFFFFLSPSGYQHNPYNGVICNDTITATGVFASKELWRLAKGKSGVDLEWTKIPPLFCLSLMVLYIFLLLLLPRAHCRCDRFQLCDRSLNRGDLLTRAHLICRPAAGDCPSRRPRKRTKNGPELIFQSSSS